MLDVLDGHGQGEPPVRKLVDGARDVRSLMHAERILHRDQHDARPSAREVAIRRDRNVHRGGLVGKMGQADQLVAQVVQAAFGLAAGPDARDGRQVVRADRRD